MHTFTAPQTSQCLDDEAPQSIASQCALPHRQGGCRCVRAQRSRKRNAGNAFSSS